MTPAGFLVIDKPAGITSARALDDVKRRFGRGVKVGHAGTLDPFATGCLVALVGPATKKCERVMALPKGYLATVRLGATTDTLDPESPQTPAAVPDPLPDRAAVEAAAASFAGETDQRPPAFSAVKVKGRRAYDLARRGEAVDLPPRRVVVHAIQVVTYAWPDVRLAVETGRGFYVRALARDLSERLGTAGHLTALRRTHVGPFDAARHAGDLLPIDFLDDVG